MTVVPPNNQANAGDKIHYTFIVTNTGNVPLSNVTVTDPNVPATGGPIASLAPGASDNSTFTGNYTLTQADINADKVDNTANATGTPLIGPHVTHQYSTVTIPENPGISIVKNGVLDMTVVPPNDQVNVGDKINYTFSVTNTGNVPLTNVTVTDPKITISGGPIASLAPGVSDNSIFTGTYTLTQADINVGKVDNTANATGTPPSGPPITDTGLKSVSLAYRFVGGEVMVINRAYILAPWLVLAVILAFGGTILLLRRRRGR
jgi:hypothetical protein